MTVMMLFMIALYAILHVANVQSEECKSDTLKRGDICCKPKICELNQNYQLCSDTLYREDSCPPCPSNTFNPKRIDTSLPYYQTQHSNVCKSATEICVETACPEEATIGNLDECLKTGILKCVCNLSTGFCSNDTNTCQKWDGNVEDLGKGVGITQSCLAEKCKPGFFKDKEGYGPCLEHRECLFGQIIISNGTSTMDTQCGLPNATQTTTQSTNISDVNSTDGYSSTTISPSNVGTANHVWIVAIVTIVVFLVIVIVIIAIYCRRRRGRNNQQNRNNANAGGQEQRAQGVELQTQSGGNGAGLLTENGEERGRPPMQNEEEESNLLMDNGGRVMESGV